MKQFRTLIILVVIFIGLLIALYLQANPPSGASATPTPNILAFERIFPDLEVLDIVAIQLRDPSTQEDFTIARRIEDSQWTAPAYPDDVLDVEAATLIARTLVLMPYRRSFEITEDTDLTQFGFDPDADFYIQFIMVDGEQHSIAIGEPTFDGPTFYTLVDDRPIIYLIERAPIDFLLGYFINPPVN